MSFDILNRWTGTVVYHAIDATDISTAALAAIAAGADLTGANLTYADLTYADMRGANLTGADLTYADMRGANLTYANLRGANLTYANLRGANLRGANLTGANLTYAEEDLYAVLSAAPEEARSVADAIKDGKINGSLYEGECCCLIGTIAKSQHCNYNNIPNLQPDATRAAERWFLAIKPGDTPDNSPIAKITYEWVTRWIERERPTSRTSG